PDNVEHWHALDIDPGDVPELVLRLIDVHDEPVATATWLSHFLLCEQAERRGFSGLFGGLGGDELNAGEYEHFFYFFADLKAQQRTAELEREVGEWVRHHDHPVFRKSMAVAEQSLARVVDMTRPGLCRPDRSRI